MKPGPQILAVVFTLFAGVFNCAQYNAQPSFLALALLVGQASSAAATVISPVKKVQSGTVVMNAAARTAVITSVDTSRAFVICHFITDSSTATNVPTCNLTNSTSVDIQAGAANANMTVYYTVVEFDSGANVYRGSRTMGAGLASGTVALSTSVDTTHSFPIIYSRTTDVNPDRDEQRTLRGQLSTSSLAISRNEVGIALDVEWQVVEITGSTVQSGIATIGAGQTVSTVSLNTFDTGSTFALINSSADALSNGIEQEYLVRASLSGNNSLKLTRGSSTNTADVYYSVITLNGSSVQSNSTSTAAGTTPHTDTILNNALTSIDTGRSFYTITSAIELDNSASNQDSGNWAGVLTSNQLQMIRGSPQNVRSSADWSVIQLSQ